MNTKIIQSMVVAGLLGFASSQASAVTFDFIDLIDTNNGTITGTGPNTNLVNQNPGEVGLSTFDWSKGGLTLTATATFNGGAAFAYLDSGNGGLGVCQNVSGASDQCDPGSDDNVTTNEILDLHFDQLATIDFSQVQFRDADHFLYTAPNPDIEISVDGAAFAMLDVTSTMQGTDFEFRTITNDQFYISVLSANAVAVPTPGTLVLLALGLIGLGAARRRKA